MRYPYTEETLGEAIHSVFPEWTKETNKPLALRECAYRLFMVGETDSYRASVIRTALDDLDKLGHLKYEEANDDSAH